MQQFLLKENVLTDNVLTVPSKGKIFKGNYIAIVKENTFLNAWQDKETVYETTKIHKSSKWFLQAS